MSPKARIRKQRSLWRARTARYRARLRDRVLALLSKGGEPRCQECRAYENEETRLEFAHVAPTKLKGRGRGKYHRLRDVLKHPEAYKLLCRPCHMDLDYGFDPWEPREPDPAQLELDELDEVPF